MYIDKVIKKKIISIQIKNLSSLTGINNCKYEIKKVENTNNSFELLSKSSRGNTLKLYVFVLDAGPHNIRIDDRFNTSYKIMWNQAPSCCNIQGFQLALSKGKLDFLIQNLLHTITFVSYDLY